MDRYRSLEGALRRTRVPFALLAALLWLVVAGAPAAIAAPPAPDTKSSATEPIERRPYRISLCLSFDPSARIDEARRAALLRDWQILVRRFIGGPWIVAIADPGNSLENIDLDALEPASFASLGSFDKIWAVRVRASETAAGLVFAGREFDAATRTVGPLQELAVAAMPDAPRALLQFARDLFSPTAMITGQEGGRALLTVQGASVEPASPVGAVIQIGTVFQPLRLVAMKDGKVQVAKIKHSYLQVESIEGPIARCAIISGLRDPLSNRVSRPNSLVGIGLKPGNSPLHLRFVTGPEHQPAAGYTLTARLAPDGQSRELGSTDRAGRIVLKPGFARGLVILRLLAGSVEPIVELPIMPGETSEELLISVDPRPLTVALEARLDSLRDEVVDLVALRARSEARMKARLEGEDWSGLEAELKEFARMTPRDQIASRLAELKDNAAHQQAELKTAVLTKTAQAQVTDLQSMIDRYLDDETFHAYSEALDRGRSEQTAAAKAEAKKKAGPPLARVVPSSTPKAANTPQDAASAKASDPGAASAPAKAAAAASAPRSGQPQRKTAPPTPSNQPF